MALRINSPARGLLALLGLVAVLALAGCGASGDGTSAAGSPPAAGDSPTPAKAAVETETGPDDWPFFGRVPQRTHYLPEPEKPLEPPFKQVWSFNTHALIEFPPAIANGVAYVVNKYGNPAAIRLSDRKVIWERKTKENLHGAPLTVTGPAYHEGHVYYASLGGYLISVDAGDGHVDWIHDTHSHLESSPLVVGDTLYVGTDKAELLAVDIADGHVRWTFSAPGAIKASPSYDHGRIYVADYQSSVYAVDARTGKPIWRTNTSKVAPFGKGGFFSSPAISFGRVYVGRDDGTIYAFDEKTGKVDWSFPTGASVYGSPAPAAVAGTKPTVYVGSENGIFYALDAMTGKPRWKYDVGGPVPGSATVIGHTVFTSSFKTRKTVGIDVRDHRKVFFLRQAGYTPMISDGLNLYLVGYYTVTALQSTGN